MEVSHATFWHDIFILYETHWIMKVLCGHMPLDLCQFLTFTQCSLPCPFKWKLGCLSTLNSLWQYCIHSVFWLIADDYKLKHSTCGTYNFLFDIVGNVNFFTWTKLCSMAPFWLTNIWVTGIKFIVTVTSSVFL